jgi:hypothetical protein
MVNTENLLTRLQHEMQNDGQNTREADGQNKEDMPGVI